MFKYIDCIDAATEYCPCSLAEGGECLICTQLRGNLFCDCVNWKGTCIYQEFIWNNEKSKKSRQFKICNIIDKRYIREDIVILKINLNSELIRELNNFGAYVFLKRPGDSELFSTPISIMDSDIYNQTITVVIKIAGVKTKMLDKCQNKIMVKGPYWNGIQGQRYLREMQNRNCLIIGRGIALAPAIMAAKKLLNANNHVYVLLERGRNNESYMKQYFDNLKCSVEYIRLMDKNKNITDDAKINIYDYIKKYDIKTVLSAGSDTFHSKIINFIHGIDSKINFSTVNNSIMCCGEGVCGSCQLDSPRGNKIKACKQQYNPEEIFLKEGDKE